jgi:threonylcarbamoyladenosine tRNA methylthiotransferase MtaB
MATELGTVRLVTLGCKVNQYESQHVKEALELNGWRAADDGERADLCVVNTCTVTMEGDAKSRQAIRRLHQANPGTRIVVMGCYATRAPDDVGRLPGVVRVVADKQRLPEELRDLGVETWPAGISRFDGHRRAFVKVQDGCLLNCTFCIIPSVRPTVRSREPDDIVREVAGLVAGGAREVVLTGIHLGHYGIDLSKGRPKTEWRRLWHLLERLCELPGDFRIRLSSLEAAEARDELVRVMRDQPRIVPHLHLCLQSGSDAVLRAMKRRYTSRGFLERCARLRDALDRPAFTTDIIVGFPGETDADFEATLNVARDVGFAKIHVFSYSPREGTPAAALPCRVPPGLVHERRERVRELERELAEKYCRGLVGRRLDVLVEGENPHRPGCVLGTSCRYVPVSFRGFAPALVGRLAPVIAEAVEDGVILATPLFEGDGQRTLATQTSGRLTLPVLESAPQDVGGKPLSALTASGVG